MRRKTPLTVGVALLLISLTAFATWFVGFAQSNTPSVDDALLRNLQAGGYVIYFRHAETQSQGDTVNAAGDWTSCDPNRMRQLSEAGRATSRSIGDAFRTLGIPVEQVIASEYCRAVETAELMGLGEVELTTDILNTRAASYVGGREVLIGRAQQRLGAPPREGTNTVLVAHGNVISAVADVSLSEGEAAIFRPLGDGQFELITTVGPEGWLQTMMGSELKSAAVSLLQNVNELSTSERSTYSHFSR